MAELTLRQESPLVLAKQLQQSTAQPRHAGVRLSEQALLGYLNLRGQGNEFAAAVQKTTDLTLPPAPNTCSTADKQTLCWLGPDEWLLMVPSGAQDETHARLRKVLSENGQQAAVTDVSGGFTTITISGQQARAVLAKGCPLDLHPRVFNVGQCGQSLLAKATVLLIPRNEDSLAIIVRRSFADYLWRWLVDAAGEYGLAVV